ncbi:MAG: hypothetical protein COT81_04390 [Candidatus Buchananbacteria bacterium CG10_big_fil_rev_8_21_14_0_10_42_9]|uniref:Uncharacterized protein n=1 Tax=Candidatus Buchananbacteria bacterium CG10_big_fil_rev_8_21_14_0_10_42_9 TaxID=1974526 RepID=A0A2H0W0F3_9BACT|nr:MAG: hypothetical protein COT81_04390 [Candidatus Buchananbacteria bacterium CG10_big_fil_rev_8_21_14_0_10_42_9]
MKKLYLLIFVALSGFYLLTSPVVLATSIFEKDLKDDELTNTFIDKSKLPFEPNTASPGEIASRGIKAFLTILGVIFIILIIYGGFIWMKSMGNEDEIERAKRILRASIIGLIIILAAYSITLFIFDTIIESTSGFNG